MLNGMVVYRDGNHMTSTFAASLAPVLSSAIISLQKTPVVAPQMDLAASSVPDMY
jgi:hypothetical protein